MTKNDHKSSLNSKNNLTNDFLGSKYPNIDTHHAPVVRDNFWFYGRIYDQKWPKNDHKSSLNSKNNLTNDFLGAKYPNVDTHHAPVARNNFFGFLAKNDQKWLKMTKNDHKSSLNSKNNITIDFLGSKYPNVDTHHAPVVKNNFFGFLAKND